MEGCGDDESRVLGAHARDARNDSGKRLLYSVTNCKLAVTDRLFSTRKEGGTSHTHSGTSPNGRERTQFILTRQAHRLRVHGVNVVSQPLPPAKVDSDHNPVRIYKYDSVVILRATANYENPENTESPTSSVLYPMEVSSTSSHEGRFDSQPTYAAP